MKYLTWILFFIGAVLTGLYISYNPANVMHQVYVAIMILTSVVVSATGLIGYIILSKE